jgi:hypothetical protein
MADKEWDQNYNTLDYAIMCSPDATLQIYEKGLAVGPLGKPYTADDTFGISIEEFNTEAIIRYRQNGILFYSSAVPPVFPLKVAISVREDATIREVRIFSA